MRFALLALLPLAVSAKNSRSRARSGSSGADDLSPRDDTATLGKRDSYSGRATFYDVGLGACGGYNVASDWIVAQNSAQYGSGYPGPNCGKSITIQYGGKTAVATIQDECPTCPYGGLDMSRGLFDYFASESVGEFQMTWWYNDGSSSNNNNNNQQQQQQASTSTTQQWTPAYTPSSTTPAYTPPTSTYTPPTSTWTPSSTSDAPSTTAASAAASSSNSSSDSSSSASNSTSAAASASSSTTGDANGSSSNLALINQAVAYYGRIIVTGAEDKAKSA